MEIEESPRRARRRNRLTELLQEFGGASQVARESGTPNSYFSALITGKRGLGDKLADKLEKLYGKPQGWFDTVGKNAEGQPAGLRPLPVRDLILQLHAHLVAVDEDVRNSVVNVLIGMAKRSDDPAYAAFAAENIEYQLTKAAGLKRASKPHRNQ